MQTYNATRIAHQLVQDKLSNAKYVVDATAGNGKDTLFIAQNTPENAIIWAFDIQPAAIANTKDVLANHGYINKVRLILDSHANIGLHIHDPINIAMFNLGYLPQAAHDITTQAQSTIAALQQIINLLSIGGVISLIAYTGHLTGQYEHQEVRKFIAALPANSFTVGCWTIINHAGNPPILYLIEKVR